MKNDRETPSDIKRISVIREVAARLSNRGNAWPGLPCITASIFAN